ncbi:hypothetical protein HDV05_001419 [Chytridiales sp. JEL 0842]|nr:hypothetical protein HDV05_001419 [Chytridiales sp. JEL 0842]
MGPAPPAACSSLSIFLRASARESLIAAFMKQSRSVLHNIHIGCFEDMRIAFLKQAIRDVVKASYQPDKESMKDFRPKTGGLVSLGMVHPRSQRQMLGEQVQLQCNDQQDQHGRTLTTSATKQKRTRANATDPQPLEEADTVGASKKRVRASEKGSGKGKTTKNTNATTVETKKQTTLTMFTKPPFLSDSESSTTSAPIPADLLALLPEPELQSSHLHLELTTIPAPWFKALAPEFSKPYFLELKQKLEKEREKYLIYPPENEIYSFMQCDLDKVKVVILGQDPYHGPSQAHGLAFSVKKGIALPPSLRNIYKQLASEYPSQFPSIPSNGYLGNWVSQGVLLLNTTLTVRASNANSHAEYGWSEFTQAIIHLLNSLPGRRVFMLWGAHAHKKGEGLDEERHLVLRSAHPSPLSARRGFMGCGHFAKANAFLEAEVGVEGVRWWEL